MRVSARNYGGWHRHLPVKASSSYCNAQLSTRHRAWRDIFFTVVTYGRKRIFESPIAVCILGESIRRCQAMLPMEINAIVLLPDHWHTIWTLPLGDGDYSKRLVWIKREFTLEWLNAGGLGLRFRLANRVNVAEVFGSLDYGSIRLNEMMRLRTGHRNAARYLL